MPCESFLSSPTHFEKENISISRKNVRQTFYLQAGGKKKRGGDSDDDSDYEKPKKKKRAGGGGKDLILILRGSSSIWDRKILSYF